uniref:Uncharacterized protein n=1 Tax=Ditylenchus dipsaci TaxID=166011 RepID=A0A915EKZ8_9BILA
MCESFGQMTLVVNRCVAIFSAEVENLIFGGWRIYVWYTMFVSWGSYCIFHIMPVTFTGSILIGSLILSLGIETSRLEIMWHRRI